MNNFGTILRIDNQSSFGSAGGVHVNFDDGKQGFLAGCYYKPTRPVQLQVGARVELLEGGRRWTVHSLAETAEAGHPDSHPEPPAPTVPIPRRPRTIAEAVAKLQEPSGFDLLMAKHDRTNELLQAILGQLQSMEQKPI